jgi:thiol-disulfide isomerase/thioredoxin
VRWRLALLSTLVLVSVLATLAATCSSGSETRTSFLVARASGPMPAIAGRTLTGGRISPADYRGKVVVVNFWNPDCPPCRREAPTLQADRERLAGLGVEMVGVMYIGGNWPDDRTAAREFLREFRVTYPSVVDESSNLARDFGIPAIPSTVVVDRSGQMRWRVLGELEPGELAALIAQL